MGRRSNGSNTSPTSSTEDGDATLQDETARLLSGVDSSGARPLPVAY